MQRGDEAYDNITEALDWLRERSRRIRLYRDYYGGRHQFNFATEKYTNVFAMLFAGLRLNLCKTVVDAPADRLEVTGFGVQTGNTSLSNAAWEIWNRNRMDLRAGEVHDEAFQTGDSYVIVWPGKNDGLARLHPNPPEMMYVRYDDEEPDLIQWAAKVWLVRDDRPGAPPRSRRLRANLYYPDRLEKYVTTGAVTLGVLPQNASRFEALEVPGETWPLVYEWGPIGVPVFHFPNNSCGCPGESELTDVIPLQDALNKTLADGLVAQEFEAFAQRWAVGVEPKFDPQTGKEVPPFQAGVDRIFTTGNDQAKFGEFTRADLKNFLAVADFYKLSIAQVSGTPLHHLALMTDPPSGEALKTLESRFVKKCKDRQTAWGNGWENVMVYALQVEKQAQAGDLLSAQWVDPAPRSAREDAEVQVLKQQVGVSKRQSLKEMGYTDQEIDDMLEESQQEATSAAEMALRRFDAGGAAAGVPAGGDAAGATE